MHAQRCNRCASIQLQRADSNDAPSACLRGHRSQSTCSTGSMIRRNRQLDMLAGCSKIAAFRLPLLGTLSLHPMPLLKCCRNAFASLHYMSLCKCSTRPRIQRSRRGSTGPGGWFQRNSRTLVVAAAPLDSCCTCLCQMRRRHPWTMRCSRRSHMQQFRLESNASHTTDTGRFRRSPMCSCIHCTLHQRRCHSTLT